MNNASSVSNISDDEDGCFIISCLVYMVVSGFFVNGPYALITTAVSASLVSQVYKFMVQVISCSSPT